MILEVKYLFPSSSSGTNFYIDHLPEDLGMNKILAHDIRMWKHPQTKADIFWIFWIIWQGPEYASDMSSAK